jgi:ABC-type multidrug transport system, ATPase component
LRFLKRDNFEGDDLMYAVKCENLSKKYKSTLVLDDITLNLEENKIYGLLGRNGAGKTTLLNIISGLVFNSSGNIKIFEEKHYENDKILNKLCFVRDKIGFMNNLKIKQIFSIASNFFENWDEAFKNELILKFKLDENKKYRNLSKGMEAMIGIIIGLASRAPLTIFDEAYSGLDMAARQLFYDILLKDYLENPRTIIFSTHLIDEVSNLFEEIIIIHEGKLLLHENIDTINEKAYVLTGDEPLINKATEHKNALKLENIGSAKRAYVFDEFSSKELKAYSEEGINIKPLSLGELFVCITEM